MELDGNALMIMPSWPLWLWAMLLRFKGGTSVKPSSAMRYFACFCLHSSGRWQILADSWWITCLYISLTGASAIVGWLCLERLFSCGSYRTNCHPVYTVWCAVRAWMHSEAESCLFDVSAECQGRDHYQCGPVLVFFPVTGQDACVFLC